MATFGAAVGSPNVVLGEILWNDNGTGATVISSVVDDKGNTYNLGTKIHDGASNLAAQPFWRGNITNGPVTFTVTFSTSAVTAILIRVDEYSGAVALNDPSDGNTGQLQSPPPAGTDAQTSGSITTTGINDLIWSGTANFNGVSVTTGTGFTNRGNQTNYVTIEDKNLASPGTTAGTWTWNSSGNTATHVVAIK